MDKLFVVLLLLSIICLVVGLIKPALVIRWGDPDKRNRKKVLISYLGAALIFTVACGMSADTKNQPLEVQQQQQQPQESIPETKTAPVAAPTVAPEQTSTDPLATEVKIESIVKDKADAYYTDTIIKKVGQDFVVEAHLKNSNYMFEVTSMDIIKALYTSNLPINLISIIDSEDMTDKYGNSKLQTAGRVDVTKQTATKINWENSDDVDIFEVADKVTLSPALSKLLKQ